MAGFLSYAESRLNVHTCLDLNAEGGGCSGVRRVQQKRPQREGLGGQNAKDNSRRVDSEGKLAREASALHKDLAAAAKKC